MKIKAWVGVEVFSYIVEDVHIFFSEEEALKWFKNYTGCNLGDELPEDFDETKIFEVEINLEDYNPSKRRNLR